MVARDQQRIHFRRAEPPTANPDKYEFVVKDCDGRLLAFGLNLWWVLPSGRKKHRGASWSSSNHFLDIWQRWEL
jgi:hypothetical protein